VSYDLNFWRFSPGASLPDDEVYRRLCNGERLASLEELPIDEILKRIRDAFSDWEQRELIFDGGSRGGFQLSTTPQWVRVDCYECRGNVMNTFIDILHDYGCPPYDPQVGRRFDGN
jgi:hypothetical protein